jgi:hypothetical protein
VDEEEEEEGEEEEEEEEEEENQLAKSGMQLGMKAGHLEEVLGVEEGNDRHMLKQGEEYV